MLPSDLKAQSQSECIGTLSAYTKAITAHPDYLRSNDDIYGIHASPSSYKCR
jgi:hypothetical protein